MYQCACKNGKTALMTAPATKRPSLRAYLVTLVMLVLIPTVAIVAAALLRAGESYRHASSQQLLETANVVAQSVQSELQARAQIISAFASRPVDDVSLPDSNISSVRLRRTAEGWQIEGELAKYVPPAHVIETADRGRMTVSDLLDIETDHGSELAIAVSAPRQVDENTLEVSTLIGQPHVMVQTLLRKDAFSNDMILAVTDGHGRILARSRDPQRFIGLPAPDWATLQAMNKPQGTFEARSVDGPMVIFAFQTIRDTPGWIAVTGEPLAMYNARWQQPLVVLLAVSAVTLLGALALATLVARRVLRPIQFLAQQAHLAAEGGTLESAGFAHAPSVVAEFDTLRESLQRAEEQTRRSHAALQRSYEALRQAERVAKVGNWSVDLATRHFSCSEMMYAMNGADPNGPPLTLEDLPKLVAPESVEKMRAAIERAIKFGESYGMEVECLRIGGHSFAGYVRGEAVRDESGNIVGLRGTVQDISEREEQRQRIAALADNLPNGAIFRIEEHDGALRVTYISAGIEQIVGVSAARIVPDGTAFIRAVHSDDLPGFKAAIRESLRQGTPFDRQFRMIHRDGLAVWVHCRSVRRVQSDGRQVWDGIVRDVTGERLAAEAQRKAKEAAEQAERSKSDFLAMMSHEIRTPMNTIIGMTRLTLQTSLAPRQRNYLEKIDAAAKNLLGIINDILDLSKIEAGGLELEETVFKLDSVLESVSAVTAMPAEEKGLEIAYAVDPSLPKRLRGDPLRLGQVLTNLVGNAVKFTERGEIVVTIEPTQGPDGSSWVRFSVRDTGIGLDAEQISRLFRPFTQASRDTTRRYGGTGLGLAICKRLVEMMGGTIGVESTPGLGSTFYFSLPLTTPSDALITNRFAAPRMVRIKGQRALIVDDNASSRQILCEMVQSFGMEAEAVPSGAHALEHLEAAARDNKPFDIVLMDWRMPTMDGLETARLIRENEQLEHVPAVLMVTAYGREEVTRRAEKLGLQGVLIKPLTESVLFNTLADVLLPADTELPAQDDPTANPAALYSALNGKRVLVVDDNAFNREVATDFLLAVGVIVDTAVDGEDAIEKIQSGQFDAVLMDTHMPRKDGLTAARELRSNPRWAQLPIISLTAQARREDQQASLEAGMTAYLTKPIDETLLYRTLMKVMTLEAPTEIGQAPANAPLTRETPADDFQLEAVEHRLRGREATARLLQGFIRDFGDAPQRLRDLLAARNVAEIASLVHSLKGSASYLSSRELFQVGDALEHAARTDDWESVQRELPAYADRIERVLAAIRAAVATYAAREQAVTDVDPQRILDDIGQALPLIARGDYAATAVLARIHAALKGTQHEALARTAQNHFDELALDSAASALARLAEILNDERIAR
jgi:two-component system sensor histidine kinase/response regulator